MKKDSFTSNFMRALASGILISIACLLYIRTGQEAIGAILFSFALYYICIMKLKLFTGEIAWKFDLVTLAGNIIGCFIAGSLIYCMNESLRPALNGMAASKASLEPLVLFLKAVFCGCLMYLAVKAFKDGRPLGIFFAIPVFILCGFEHSVADTAYFMMSDIMKDLPVWNTGGVLATAFLGNSVGAIAMRILCEAGRKERKYGN